MDYKELLKKLKKYAKRNGLFYEWEAARGKGGHGTLYLGDKFTVMPTAQGELKTGTQKAIITQLGLKDEDI
ncbi:MAG: type II toxin-antitoxin system HicA family toxin [Alphaproteobacteria bacterium]|nr:type II toxin-antitoxin system HicA family toxin [Alphaproteobacteria bacterium]